MAIVEVRLRFGRRELGWRVFEATKMVGREVGEESQPQRPARVFKPA